MGDHNPKFRPGADVTFDVSAAVTGGQLVAVSGERTVAPCGANEVDWLGVAATDAAIGEKVLVESGGYHLLTASGAIAAGDELVTAAAGAVATGVPASPAALVGTAVAAASGGTVLVKLAR